jgi:PhnB protein
MIIPHLHFTGTCKEAIELYEKAFKTEVEEMYLSEDSNTVSHAVMNIHNQTVYLNDRFGAKEKSTDISTNLVVIFDSIEDFMYSYEILKEGSLEIDPITTWSYSPLVVQFIDKYNVQWGFMVKSQQERM